MIKQLATLFMALFLATATASAVEVGGLDIPDTLDSGMGELVLNGTGIRKKFGFKVYVGGLYLKAKSSDSRAIIDADEPMAITMTWKRTGPVDKVTGVFAEGFQYAAGADYDAIKGDIDTFLATVVKAEKQDVWKYLYLPGTGVQVYYNDTLSTTLTDFRFKKALFAVWLLEGETFSGDKSLRDGMLGK